VDNLLAERDSVVSDNKRKCHGMVSTLTVRIGRAVSALHFRKAQGRRILWIEDCVSLALVLLSAVVIYSLGFGLGFYGSN
jgi:hypothetical protein